jgi:DNA processing protein
MPDVSPLLRLTLTPGLGPILISRLVGHFGSPEAVLGLSARELERARGIGPEKARTIVKGLRESQRLAEEELREAQRLGVRIIDRGSPEYPPLLASIPDAPPLLYVRGRFEFEPAGGPEAGRRFLDEYPVAIIGSRRCTAYGVEQAERFAGILARSGLTIVSGGARGIDTAAHRGALRSGGRTIAVLGCGLAECYPPDNQELFDRIAERGAVISELPLHTSPDAKNFPARNRIISGLSLGVIVIEAGKRSGALITARLAAEDHAREVMVVPGRVDSRASEGSHELVKKGGAALVTEPGDVLETLETPARHTFQGTHASRYADPSRADEVLFDEPEGNGPGPAVGPTPGPAAGPRGGASDGANGGAGLTDVQRVILEAMDSPKTPDELVRLTGLPPEKVRAELTLLEIQGRAVRQGSRIARRARK